MKNLTITIPIACMAVILLVSPVRAEMATMDEALTVANNWVYLIMQKEGHWGGSEWAEVAEIQEFTRGERLLGYFFRVNPKGYIVISLRKELAPVKAYSAISDLDPESDEGMTDFIKSGMERTLDEIEGQVGPILLAETQDLQKVVETDHRTDWEELELDAELFDAGLESGVVLMNYAGGEPPLLTSNWQQGNPYNRWCPAVYEWNYEWDLSPSGRTPTRGRKLCGHGQVGCVALAGAQIMRYWAWPPKGKGHHGDVYYTDTYDWANMPDTLTTSSPPQVQINAVAELCREAGRAAGTSYGCSKSSAWCGDKPWGKDMCDAYKDHFRYSKDADSDWRVGESTDSWFNKIKNNLNKNRPLQYYTAEFDFPGIAGHSMVCDGWREVGGMFQCHMNDGSLSWVDMTNLPGAEGMLKDIRPAPSLGSWLSEDPPDEHVSYWSSSSATDPSGYRYFDQDATGRNVTFQRGHKLQFLAGVKVRCTSHEGDYIRFVGTSSENTRLFSIKGTKDGGLVAGIRIYNGGIRLYRNGSIKFHPEPVARPASLTVISPNGGGEHLCTDSRYSIVWQTQGTISNVDIQYSSDNGATWYRVAYNVGNTGSYDWLVPAGAIISDQCLVRIKDASNSSVFDTSNSTFSIMICVPECPLPPTGLSATQGPVPGQIILRWNRSPDATGYKIFYDDDASNPPFGPTQDGSPSSGSGVGNVTQVTISGLNGGEIYYFAVKAYNATCESDYSAQDSELVPSEPVVCYYATGDRVILLVDNPREATNLPAGTCGTVLCTDSADPELPVLVSWDMWYGGYSDRDMSCDTQPPRYPNNTAYWMACDQIAPGCTEGYFDECGVVIREVDRGVGYLLFEADTGLRYHVGLYGFQLGDRIRVRGMVSFCIIERYQVNGCIDHAIVSQCVEAQVGCCSPPYSAGDRVRLLVSNPNYAVGLPAGTYGTVLCCDADDPDMPIFVSWDGWTEGWDKDEYCDIPPGPYPPESGYWVSCDQIAPFTGPREPACCDIPYPPGARVRSRVSSPRGAAGLVTGMLGTVICCDYDDPDLPIFVSWDGWSNGRNSDSYCDTSVWSYPADSGWWMACHEIAPFTELQ